MKILKNLFGNNTKISTNDIADETGRLLSQSVIVESGSNANENWVRYADGTQICWVSRFQVGQGITTAIGNFFRSDPLEWTYPKPFISIPSITHSADVNVAYSWTSLGNRGASIANAVVCVISTTSNSTVIPSVSIVAIGRWK